MRTVRTSPEAGHTGPDGGTRRWRSRQPVPFHFAVYSLTANFFAFVDKKLRIKVKLILAVSRRAVRAEETLDGTVLTTNVLCQSSFRSKSLS